MDEGAGATETMSAVGTQQALGAGEGAKPEPAVGSATTAQQVRLSARTWLPWLPCTSALVVILLFLKLQPFVFGNGFKLFTTEAPGFIEATRKALAAGPLEAASFDAAATHWTTAIFVASALMVPLVGCSVWLLLGSALDRRYSLVIGLGALGFALVLWQFPDWLTNSFIERELALVAQVSWLDPRPVLVKFLSALFATALLMGLSLGVALKDVVNPEPAIERLLQVRSVVRSMLALTTTWLVVGVVGVGLFHRMVAAGFSEPQSKVVETLGASSTILSGALYSALMAAMFGPVEVLLRQAAGKLAANQGVAPEGTEKWLGEQGFDLSLTNSLMRVLAVFGPLLAGVIQNLAQLPS